MTLADQDLAGSGQDHARRPAASPERREASPAVSPTGDAAAQLIVRPVNRDIAWFYGRAGARGRRCSGSRAFRTWPRVRRGRGRGAGREDQLGDRQASRRQAGRTWRPVRPGCMGKRRYGLGLGRAGHRRYRRDAACLLGHRSHTQGINQSGAFAWIGDDDYQLGEHWPAGPGCADLGRHCGHQRCLRSPPAPPAPPALTVAVPASRAPSAWVHSVGRPGQRIAGLVSCVRPTPPETDDLSPYRGIAVRLG